MQVPATGKQAGQSGPAHKRGVVTVTVTDLLGHATEQNCAIGSSQPILRIKSEFDLTGPEFGLHRPQRQSKLDCLQA